MNEARPDFHALSAQTGVNRFTLLTRWQSGDRGDRLLRPARVTGRKISVPKLVKTARDVLRRHLREEGYRIIDLAEPWNMKPKTVEFYFYHKRRPHLEPWQIEAAAKFLRLDADDTRELHRLAAQEAGWKV